MSFSFSVEKEDGPSMASGATITFSSLWGHLVPSHTWKDTERGRRMNEPSLLSARIFSWFSSLHLYISLKSYCHSRHRLGFHSCHFQIYSGTSSGLQTSFLTRWLSPGSHSHVRLNETHRYLKKTLQLSLDLNFGTASVHCSTEDIWKVSWCRNLKSFIFKLKLWCDQSRDDNIRCLRKGIKIHSSSNDLL